MLAKNGPKYKERYEREWLLDSGLRGHQEMKS